MAASPLKARWDATGVWTGSEMLVLGGRDYACDPRACGPAPRPGDYARQVVAYNPAEDRWRTLADTPFAPTDISAAVIGHTVYVLTGTNYGRPRLYALDLDANHWRRLATPPRDRGPDVVRSIVAAGTGLFAWYPYPRSGHPADLLYDPATDTWTVAPRSPLGASLNRAVLGLPDGRVISLGADSAGTSDPKTAYDLGPRFYTAAVFDPGAGRWTRLPKAPFVQSDTTQWSVAGGRVVNLSPQRDDGYRHAKRKTYPIGGELDVTTKHWSALPARPSGWTSTATYYWATAAGGDVALAQGWALDVRRGTWLEVPRIPGDSGELDSPAVAWTGTTLLAWGGRTHGSKGYATTNTGWIWEPAAASDVR